MSHESYSSAVFVNNTTNIVTSKKSSCKAEKSCKKLTKSKYSYISDKKKEKKASDHHDLVYS